MLKLIDIKKDYAVGDMQIPALKGISVEFRENEFVSILGQSGCGKTTLLNIIGGLDQYTSGDLIINGKSTKKFKDADWDTYRNHSIGFVFQSYNLIPHQTILANVELALTLSGVSAEERRKRATQMLEKVGLGDQLTKRPNQLSGGQMQRVAIARALINDPDILLADEPTGALDSATSIQIMEILKEISKEKLIIMVTHNPELAQQYSSRIIKLLDGNIIDDSNPYVSEQADVKKADVKKKKSMSFFTALRLSLNNLMTKKGRTFLTAFAGSIGIIGISLILSVSSGVNAYIDSIEESTMSSYPIMINESTMDTAALLSSFNGENQDVTVEEGHVASNNVMIKIMSAMSSGITSNNLTRFKSAIDSNYKGIKDFTTEVKYLYSANLNTYSISYDENGVASYKRNISGFEELMEEIGVSSSSSDPSMSLLSGGSSSSMAWSELVGDNDYIASQYDVLSGRLPENSNEVVLITDESRKVPDYILYMLGIRDTKDLKDYITASKKALTTGETVEEPAVTTYTFEEILNYRFKALLDSDYYKVIEIPGNKNEIPGNKKRITDATNEDILAKLASDDCTTLQIVGIIAPKPDTVVSSSVGAIGYTSSLMPSLIEKVNNSDVVTLQKDNSTINMKNGTEFKTYDKSEVPTLRIMLKSNSPESAVLIDSMSDEMILKMFNVDCDTVLKELGYVDINAPSAIQIYPKDFESKDNIVSIIKEYNEEVKSEGNEKDKITYTDTVALLMSSVTTIVNAISYVLIAFVAISLIVSSIMIGIITYISVLERTKEIGILRAIGASKKDISRVFNAETMIVGFTAGIIGIGVTIVLDIIISIILRSVTGISSLTAFLQPLAAVILVLISISLTLIAGLIPSRIAAKKDPVTALRTE